MKENTMRSDSYACINMGETYTDLGRYEEAIKWYEKAIAIDAEDSYAYYCMGSSYRKLGNFSRALECLIKTIQINPDDGNAALEIGESYLSMGDCVSADEWFNGAIERYKKAVQEITDDDKLYANMANAYCKLQKEKEALEALKKAVNINPGNIDARTALGELKKMVEGNDSKKNEVKSSKNTETDVINEEKLRGFFSDSVEKSSSNTIYAGNESLSEIFAELDTFVGLNSVKKEVLTLINFIEVQNSRADLGLKTSPISYHLVFTGNPGTGKTTIAKMLGKIYKNLGILQNGTLVETDRSGLVGEKPGHSTEKVNKIADSAIGGILFIDDAVSLYDRKNDFAKEAISALVKKMDSEKNKFVLILAGQTAEMTNFMEMTPALSARFNRYIEFPDYTPDEMLRIFSKHCVELEYNLTEAAELKLRDLFKNVYATRDQAFGNAIFVRNVFEKTIEKQANRIVKFSKLTKEILTVIEADDIPGS